MNRFALAVGTVLILGGAGLTAQARSEPEASVASDESIVVREESASKSALHSDCIRETGTRLRKRDANGCTGAPGRSFDREQIERSGATDTGDAIRRLSPAAGLSRGG